MSIALELPLPVTRDVVTAPWVDAVVTSDGIDFTVVEVSDLFVRVRFMQPGFARPQHGVLTHRSWRVIASLTTAGAST